MLWLEETTRTDYRLLDCMKKHYSQPKGFVGRNICYSVMFDATYYGHIVGGSATRFLPGRNEFFGVGILSLNNIINNVFYHIEPNPTYPVRNFTVAVLKEFRKRVSLDWQYKYDDTIIGFESLVELPRTGETYRRDGWTEVGQTIGYTCKRVGGAGTDSWGGKRVWDTKNLRPKRVFVRKR